MRSGCVMGISNSHGQRCMHYGHRKLSCVEVHVTWASQNSEMESSWTSQIIILGSVFTIDISNHKIQSSSIMDISNCHGQKCSQHGHLKWSYAEDGHLKFACLEVNVSWTSQISTCGSVFVMDMWNNHGQTCIRWTSEMIMFMDISNHNGQKCMHHGHRKSPVQYVCNTDISN